MTHKRHWLRTAAMVFHAQFEPYQSTRLRRIGGLSGIDADDPETQARISALVEALQHLGWTDGGNVRIDHRWGGGDADNILATGGSATEQFFRATRTVPIVFPIIRLYSKRCLANLCLVVTISRALYLDSACDGARRFAASPAL